VSASPERAQRSVSALSGAVVANSAAAMESTFVVFIEFPHWIVLNLSFNMAAVFGKFSGLARGDWARTSARAWLYWVEQK
jgi:hypothetical protein